MTIIFVLVFTQFLLFVAILAGFIIAMRAGWYAKNNRDPLLSVTTPVQTDQIVTEKTKKAIIAMREQMAELG